jgi:hypothetical protein
VQQVTKVDALTTHPSNRVVSGMPGSVHFLSPTPLLPCRILATNCETLARFSPQTAKPEIFAAKYA